MRLGQRVRERPSSRPPDADPEMEISQQASISVGDLKIEKASGGNAKLTWTEPQAEPGHPVTRFHVYRLDPVTLFWTQIAELTKQTESYLDPVLNDDVARQYKITAVIKPQGRPHLPSSLNPGRCLGRRPGFLLTRYHPRVTPFARRLAGVFVLALALRSLHTAAIGRAPFSRLLVGDGLGYDRWAASIAAGDWIGKETFYQAPLYPYALATLYATAGRDPMTIRWVQAVLGALACVLLTLAGRRWLSERAGLAAGVLLALYPPAIFFDGLVQKASLDNLLMCALLAVLGAYAASGRDRLLTAAGAVLGLFALTRENALVFLVILVAWLPFHLAGRPVGDRAKAIALLAAGVAVVLVPVGLRNKAVGGDFLITTSQAGPNFYIGNHEGATGRYLPLRPDRETYAVERIDATELAEASAGRRLTPGEVSSYWWTRSFEWIRAHPGAWVGLLAKKALVTWNRAELPDSESLEVYADYSPVLAMLAAVFGFGVLVALAAPGWPFRGLPRRVPFFSISCSSDSRRRWPSSTSSRDTGSPWCRSSRCLPARPSWLRSTPHGRSHVGGRRSSPRAR